MVNGCNYYKMKVIYWLHSCNYYKEMAWSWFQIKLKRHKIQFHFLKICVKVDHIQNVVLNVTHWPRSSFCTDVAKWHISRISLAISRPSVCCLMTTTLWIKKVLKSSLADPLLHFIYEVIKHHHLKVKMQEGKYYTGRAISDTKE